MWSVSLGYKNYMVTTHGDTSEPYRFIGFVKDCESLVWDKAFRCFCSGALVLTLFDRTWELAKPKEQVLYCTVSIHQLCHMFFLAISWTSLNRLFSVPKETYLCVGSTPPSVSDQDEFGALFRDVFKKHSSLRYRHLLCKDFVGCGILWWSFG